MILSKSEVIDVSLSHWNYFLAVEEDLNGVSRYIEFDNNNYKTYSLELARILMGLSKK